MENDRIFNVLKEFEATKNPNRMLENLKEIYDEELKSSFQEIEFPSKSKSQDNPNNMYGFNEERNKNNLSVNTEKNYLNNKEQVTVTDVYII